MIRINLLPVRAARKKEAVQRHLVLFVIGLVLILLVGFIVYQGKASELKDIQATNARLQDDIENLKKIIGEVQIYKEQQALLARKLDVIKKLRADKTGPVRMLDEIASNIPEKLWLQDLTETEARVQLKGVAINNEVIATFMSRLEDSDYFREVYLVSIERVQMEDLKLKKFTVTARLIADGGARSGGAG